MGRSSGPEIASPYKIPYSGFLRMRREIRDSSAPI